jgi:hypothetical protein
MLTASWQDVLMAGFQGSITKVTVPGRNSTDNTPEYTFFASKATLGKNINERNSVGPLAYYIYLAASCLLFMMGFLRCMMVSNRHYSDFEDMQTAALQEKFFMQGEPVSA